MNKQVIRYLKWTGKLVCVMLVAALAGCQSEDEFTSSGQTGLRLALTDAAEHTYSRKSPSELEQPLGSAFNLQVVSSGTDKTVYKGNFKESILLKEGLYNLTASYGENPVIALDAPYYVGTLEEQKVVKGKMTSASIPCSVANALLSVIYNEETLKKVYESYQVVVSVADESVVLDASSGKSAYFRAGSSVKLLFQGKQLGSGKEVSYEIPNQEQFNAIAAKKHVKVTLGVDVASIPSGVGVSIEKLQVETVSIAETIPMEYMPKPKLEAEGFVNNELSFAETEKKLASVRLKLASPLQDLKLKFKSTDAKFASLSPEKEYLLSNTEDKAAVETALGITLPEIGSKEGTLDFTSLIPQLMTDKGVTVESVVEIDVKANNRWSSDKETDAQARTYSLKCNKPDFSAIVSPDNIWTKEFTIDGCDIRTGDMETISSRVKYQYRKKNEQEWIDCDKLVQFETCPESKNYEVRAVYREGIETEVVDVTLETPQQLPNSGMEEWSTVKGDRFTVSDSWFTKKTYYRFYPYSSGENDIWWATNNSRSQDGKIILGMAHPVAFSPCVSYSETVKYNGSRSALIYTSGHGGGYSSTGEIIYTDGAFAGCLFVGTYEWKDGTENMNLGHAFSSRPTSIKFWYNYIPKNSDSFKVYVELKNGEEIIGTGTYIPNALSAESGWQEELIPIDYLASPKQATSISVQFLSTNKDSFSSSDFNRNRSMTFPVMGDWKVHIGSMLYIDDISLVYDK